MMVSVEFRKRSGASLCYACGKINRVDAPVCFYCGRRNPGLWGFGASIGRLVGGLDFARAVIAVCILAYVASLLLNLPAAMRMRGPLGFLSPSSAALDALGMTGTYAVSRGRWWTLLTAIYLHGGISPRYASTPLKQINDAVSDELSDISSIKPQGPVMADDGPLWYRGLAQDDGPETAALVDKILAAQGAKRIVIAHTPTAGAVMPRFDGKVILIDTGMATVYGSHRACLLVEGDGVFAIHRGQKLELPGNGPGLAEYLKKAVALEPPDSSLRKAAAEK